MILFIQVKIFGFFLFLLLKIVFEIVSTGIQLIFYASPCSVTFVHSAKLHANGFVFTNEIRRANSMGQTIETGVKIFELVKTCFLKNSVLFFLQLFLRNHDLL